MTVFLNSPVDFACILHDVMYILRSVAVQNIESNEQDVETKAVLEN